MITQRQRTFRESYRSELVGWYNGYVHVAVIYGIGAGLFYVFLQNLHDVQWWEWMIVSVTFLAGNLFEWFLHRYVMHRPFRAPALRAIYDRHTLAHHRFFTDDEVRFLNHRDWRVTVFPTYAIVVFTLLIAPAAFVIGQVLTPNVGWLLMLTTTGMYLLYEFMHFCCHVDENWFVRHCPFVNTLRRHHTAHHNTHLMMETNMNLTFPIADWLFGTSDLDRGLVGHLFNGYDTKHIRTDLRDAPKSPPQAAVGKVSV